VTANLIFGAVVALGVAFLLAGLVFVLLVRVGRRLRAARRRTVPVARPGEGLPGDPLVDWAADWSGFRPAPRIPGDDGP
jgi:hypothetical protein